jgi:phospho-N-acetylmuramoyl-pentapeptide-transferase
MTVALASAVISGVTGIVLVPFLHKLKFGQPIKTKDGPEWHAKKQGTPTMGGFMFILATVIMSLVGYGLYCGYCGIDTTSKENQQTFFRFLSCIVFILLFALIGFIDDYTKISHKDNAGLSPKQKMIMQFIFAAGFLFALYMFGDKSTVIDLGFFAFDAGIFYYIIMIPVIIYLTNAVNLTDGVDGLCITVTFVAMAVFNVAASLLRMNEMSIFSMAVAGSCIGFFFWNLNPAKCFMGDTGSMFLGAVVTAIGIMLHKHLLLILVDMVYILEALSVVIQVSYFKYTAKQHFKATGEAHKGKRIFKMTPIHHHFEMSGFSENKIVVTFSLAGAFFGVLGILSLFI